ncbi:ATP-binding protein [Bifidobacterium sp. ESL0690]|uniref:ATP-binding protein n=1 Tax=Bifidobacterium sp. ESL0690 TaxID=2983214 RepID=UPI0023F95F19|nr:ATP-binding protein [Bifidobacterium sp. ESL0690]WEV46629.1 ATP-binding protein [Bifidobacterium sp. ESL0690]
MKLQRLAEKRLKAWHNNPQHRALLIDGARQVGKTYLVRQFAKSNYDVFLEINFIETPSAKTVFEGDLNADTLIANLSIYSNKPFVPGKTLIFLDEIQECPRARTAIKFLVDDGRFDYIESGSLLGVSYKEVPSYPVGYEEHLTMYPLTLQEFYWANGIQQSVIDEVGGAFKELRPVVEVFHQRLMSLFSYYMVVGGMPAAVSAFVETNDLNAVGNVQRDILSLYRQDIAKYADTSVGRMHIKSIFDAVPSQLNKKNKRFVLADLSKTARMERYASDFMWLADAGVVLPCRNVSEPVYPLKLNEKHSLMKVFLCDVGLLSAASAGSTALEIMQGNVGVNWGSSLENFVAQELTAQGFDLFYFDKAKIGEVDFLMQRGSAIVPVEAKSGKDFAVHAALDKLLAVKEWKLDSGFVLCNSNVEHEKKNDVVIDLPWYMTMFMKPQGF